MYVFQPRVTGFCILLAMVSTAAAGTVIQPCESLEGTTLVDGKGLAGATLELNTDPQFVSQGEASLRMRATTAADARITYLSMDLPIPATDFSDAALGLDVWSATPEATAALYVRGYDAAGRCALSWMSWNAALAPNRSRVLLVPGTRSGIMKWEPQMVQNGDPSAVTRLRIYVGGNGGNQPLDLIVDRVQALPMDAPELVAPGSIIPDMRRFTDHGIGARAAELRAVVGMAGSDGRPYVIGVISDRGPRGSVLVTDVETGETHQVHCPENIPQADAFGALASARGRFYYTQGPVLLELDPVTRSWLYTGRPNPTVSVYLCFTEGQDGTIWFGGVYETQLASYNPDTGELRDHGRLDPEEKYVSFLATDRTGWLYGGIGTARCNIVAYNPETGEKRSLVPEEDRAVGTASVYPAADGSVIGSVRGTRYRLLDGKAEPIAEDLPPQRDVKAVRYGARLRDLPDQQRIQEYDLVTGKIDIAPTNGDGTTRSISFTYDTAGANITSLGTGPDDVIYGSTSHPMHFLAFDTHAKTLKDFGPIPEVGGGNFCAIAASGRTVYGAQYAAGQLWAFDVDKPWVLDTESFTIGIPARELSELTTVESGRAVYLEGHDVVFIHGNSWDARATFPLQAEGDAPAPHYLYVQPYQHTNYCSVTLSLDERPLGPPVVGRSTATGVGPVLEYGPFTLAPGEHQLRLSMLENTGESPFFGIRSACLSPQRLDTKGDDTVANPHPIGRWQGDVTRPRTALVHPDGKHVMMGGFAGYGRVGGGIGIVNLESGKPTLLTAKDDLLPGHSCITLKAFPDGNLVGGTSISAPGGGHPTAKEGELFVLDWESKTVRFRTVPKAGDGSVVTIETIGNRAYGLTSSSTFFVFDYESMEIVHRQDLAQYGSPLRHGLHHGPDGLLYIIMSDALLRVNPQDLAANLLSWLPQRATAGGALANGLLCYACGSHAWSYAVPGLRDD